MSEFYSSEKRKEIIDRMSMPENERRAMTEATGLKILDGIYTLIEVLLRKDKPNGAELTVDGEAIRQAVLKANRDIHSRYIGESKKTEHIKGIQSIVLDFSEQKVSKIAFAKTKEEAERIERQLGMTVYFPSEIANFGDNEVPMYVLLD